MPTILKKYDDTIGFGTTVALGASLGIVLSCSTKYTVKEQDIMDGEAALKSVVQYDQRAEVTVEILVAPEATIPAVGTEVTIGTIADVILTEVSEKWSNGDAKKLSLKGIKSLK